MVGKFVRAMLSCIAVTIASGGLVVPVQTATAQRVAAAPTASSTPAEAKQRVTVNFDHVSLRIVVKAIAHAAGLTLSYDVALISPATFVTIHATDVSVADAFAVVLRGTGLSAQVQTTGNVVIFADGSAASALGTIVGSVTDANTKKPVEGATVTVDRSAAGVRTGNDGVFHIAGLSAGTHVLSVRAIGYAQVKRTVTVVDDSSVTVHVALSSTVNTLDQIVVTVTGEQRVRELGHVVAQINADSLVKSAPISSVVELLQSRVPGLEVLTGAGGIVGGGASLRLRSQTTGHLDPEPIVIVDGIRFKSSNFTETVRNGQVYTGQDNPQMNGADQRSLLDDINPNDIESVEVVKGPSASTLYGPDAANGVIVITTKHGQAGKTEFKWYARPVSNDAQLDRVATTYQAYGHDPETGALFNGNCSLIAQYEYHTCVLDSIRPAPTLVSDPAYSVVTKQRPQWQYGANVSGGTPAVRYFISGNYDSQVGALHMGPAVTQALEGVLGTTSLADVFRNPNTMTDLGGHANVATDFGTLGSVSVSIGYTQTDTRTAALPGGQLYGIVPGEDTTAIYADVGQLISFLTTNEVQASRFDAALNGVYRPAPWLNVTATVGTDLAPSVSHGGIPRIGTVPDFYSYALDSRRSNVDRTLSLAVTANTPLDHVSFRSSVGVQYVYAHLDGVDVFGQTLAPGSSSVQTASTVTTSSLWDETVTLGTYGEEVVGLNDRLFLTGSLRIDGSTSFGDAYHPTPYPKVGLSWIASDEPWLHNLPLLHELRFRSSFGAASRYPTSGMKVGALSSATSLLDGSTQTQFRRALLGNPDLRPERTREAEYGADLTLLSDLHVGLTWYNRKTIDQLQQLGNAPGLLPTWENLGTIAGHGFEATASIGLLNTAQLRADLGFTYAYHTDKLLSFGSVAMGQAEFGGYYVGYPLEAVIGGPYVLGVADTVGGHPDSIAFDNEIIFSSTAHFFGVSQPPQTYTMTPTVTLFNSRLRFSSTFDRETGFVVNDGSYSFGLCLAAYVKTAPLLEQAKCYANQYVNPGDFTRWRELTVTYDIPPRFLRLRALHLAFSSASVSLQGRNLALWTGFHGSDPESLSGAVPGTSLGLPQDRSWSFRFDVNP